MQDDFPEKFLCIKIVSGEQDFWNESSLPSPQPNNNLSDENYFKNNSKSLENFLRVTENGKNIHSRISTKSQQEQ